MITVKDLQVSYGETIALSNFSLAIKQGEIYSLIGPSGCGKSTLLKVLCGIQTKYTGTLTSQDRAIKPSDIGIGYVPQHYGLLDWKTIRENIYLPFRIDHSKVQNDSEIEDIIHSLEIQDLLDRYPIQLSGGQKQRVALARAFVSSPKLLLMDEPFSSLDTFTAHEAQKIFLKLWEKHRVTTLFITHNVHEAIAIGTRIVLMSKSPGRIVESLDNKYFNTIGDEENKLKFASMILKKAGY